MKPLLAIVGPTATGKTRLALSLAQSLNGEIVSADSHQIYRFMDIGTAKPSFEERTLIPHHLLDIVTPDEPFSLALYQQLAYEVIEDIHRRGRFPFLVGGSGLYTWSVIEGWKIPQVPPDHQFRFELERRALVEGNLALYQELEVLDPAAAAKINPRNVRRVIRALEVCRATGIPFSQLQQKSSPSFPVIIIGLTTNRESLYQRIDSRVDNMIASGLVQEVQALMDRGYGLELSAMSSIGYKQIGEHLQGKLTLSKAVERIKFETHRLARHQYAWFRLADPRIDWFDITYDIERPVTEWMQIAIDRCA